MTTRTKSGSQWKTEVQRNPTAGNKRTSPSGIKRFAFENESQHSSVKKEKEQQGGEAAVTSRRRRSSSNRGKRSSDMHQAGCMTVVSSREVSTTRENGRLGVWRQAGKVTKKTQHGLKVVVQVGYSQRTDIFKIVKSDVSVIGSDVNIASTRPLGRSIWIEKAGQENVFGTDA